jgi:hypothetical protein
VNAMMVLKMGLDFSCCCRRTHLVWMSHIGREQCVHSTVLVSHLARESQ